MAYTMRKAGEKMEWMQRINRVMDYVEDHLRDDVDEEEVSRIMACPFQNFQSLFGQVTAISQEMPSVWRFAKCTASIPQR